MKEMIKPALILAYHYTSEMMRNSIDALTTLNQLGDSAP